MLYFKLDTLQGTNISHLKAAGKIIFLFYRWDMLVLWRVGTSNIFMKGFRLRMLYSCLKISCKTTTPRNRCLGKLANMFACRPTRRALRSRMLSERNLPYVPYVRDLESGHSLNLRHTPFTGSGKRRVLKKHIDIPGGDSRGGKQALLGGSSQFL